MKTQEGDSSKWRKLVGARRRRKVGFEPRVAHCCGCGSEFTFKASQVAAAHRVWRVGSGRDGIAATDLLGGDGTTRHCECGLEGEVVFTGDYLATVCWRKSRLALQD